MLNPTLARGTLRVLAALQAHVRRAMARRRAGQDPARAARRRAGRTGADPARAVLRHGRRDAAVPDRSPARTPLDGGPRTMVRGSARRSTPRSRWIDALRRPRRRRVRRVPAPVAGRAASTRAGRTRDDSSSTPTARWPRARSPSSRSRATSTRPAARSPRSTRRSGDAATRGAAARARPPTLRDGVQRAFWVEDEGSYALALDGDKRPCRERDAPTPGTACSAGSSTPTSARARGRAADGARHVLRVGHPHALERLARATTR